MNNRTVGYTLIRYGVKYPFYNAKEASDFLGINIGTFYENYRKTKSYKEYAIQKIGGSYHREAHKTRLYKIWTAMRERCHRRKHEHYKDYGGRGIDVCKEWDDYVVFKKWAEENGYADNLTIDRIDVNRNYEPSNCRWITIADQHKNKRSNRVLEYKGKKYILSDLAKEVGIGKTTLKERLNMGWSIEDAVEKPIRKRTRGYRPSV